MTDHEAVALFEYCRNDKHKKPPAIVLNLLGKVCSAWLTGKY
jgi:hypothetical protein